MKTNKAEHLSKKDLATRWKVSVRSVERTIKRYGLLPVDWFGRQPEFHPADVGRIEAARREHMMQRFSQPAIITVKEAKRRAGKRGAK